MGGEEGGGSEIGSCFRRYFWGGLDPVTGREAAVGLKPPDGLFFVFVFGLC